MDSDVQGKSCWLCGRSLGARTEWHHPVPRQKGGRAVVPLHPICHRTIHAHYTNAELARIGDDHAALMGKEVLVRFVGWVAGKPTDFYAPTWRKR